MVLPERLCVNQQPVTADSCLRTGAAYLAATIRDASPALHKRISLKLTMGVWPLDNNELPEIEQLAVAMVVEKILSFEVDPAWARSLKSFN
jgi:hypothetical protein